MFLTDEKIAAVGLLDDDIFSKDRRQAGRVSISVPVFYQVDNIQGKTKSIEISETGIRISLSRKVSLGTIIYLEIKLPKTDEYFKIKGKVVWTRPSLNQAEGWECGVAFENLRHVSHKEAIISIIADQHCQFTLKCTQGCMTQPIETLPEVLSAFRILYKEYLKRGYCAQGHGKMHYNFYSLLPTSNIFNLKRKDRTLGTISLIGDSPCGLPMESIFFQEVHQLRQEKRVVAEVGFLALDSSEFKKGFFSLTNFKKQASLFRLYKIMFDYARFSMGVTDLIIGVHPKHETLYKYLDFEQFGPVRSYQGAQDNPALPMRLDIDKTRTKSGSLKYGMGAYFFRDFTPKNILDKKFIWSNDILADLLVVKKPLWDSLTAGQQKHFEQCYPGIIKAVIERKVYLSTMPSEEHIIKSCEKLKNNLIDQIKAIIQFKDQ